VGPPQCEALWVLLPDLVAERPAGTPDPASA
jgi:hypothetical protein